MVNFFNIFPIISQNSGEFLAKIDIVENTTVSTIEKIRKPNKNNIETIVILDISGSMGQNVNRIVTQYLPFALETNGYDENDVITLITFETGSSIQKHTIKSLRVSKLTATGSTNMTPAIKNLQQVLKNSSSKKFRILTISDGEIYDQNEAVNMASLLSNSIRGQYQISSKAIRFFTSNSQPDTRGLSSVMQLNTTDNKNSIIDVNAYKQDEVTITFSDSFKDNLGCSYSMCYSDNIFLDVPWSKTKIKEINLNNGTNIFWLNKCPDGEKLKLLNGNNEYEEVQIKINEPVDFESFNSIIKDKIDYFMKRLKVLKVVGTQESQTEIDNIVNYFGQLEDRFNRFEISTSQDYKNAHTLQSRLSMFKEIKKKKNLSIAFKMMEIANDDKVRQLNSAQQAEYLRTTNTSLNAKNLAKRALKQGMDFDTVAIQEVKNMKQHINELNDIDDDEHYKSFYSQETTLGGIKTLCTIDNDTLEQMSALDILQLLNIVGVPCVGPIGDFPDPKTYHLHELMLGSFISMSDILAAKSSGYSLTDPYTKKEIINVVPFYDDDRIQQFLMKYSPTLLEYIASLGMRNMILDIPNTYKYTIVGGLWNIVQRLDSEKTEVNIDILIKLVITYKTAVDGLFDNVQPHIVEQDEYEKSNNLSYYICNNGTTNMISPIITIMEEKYNGDSRKSNYIPNILRALYSFEIYQVVRKFYRNDGDGYIQRKAMLDKLLGIDFNKYASPLPELFQTQQMPKHYSNMHLNDESYNYITDRMFWLDKMPLLPEYIYNSFDKDNGKKNLLESKKVKDEDIEKIIGINFDLKTFKLFCIVQAFLFDTKAERVDDDNKRMKIDDCGNFERMNKMISDYISKQYQSHYQSELSKQGKKEAELLTNELIDFMLYTNDINMFVKYFKDGLTRNHVHVEITDTYKLGYVELRDKIFDSNINVIKRVEKLKIFVMGTLDNNDIVWNKGNVVRISPNQLKTYYENLGISDVWDELYPLYKAKNKYIYRDSDKPNRHTHCNSKPSYWAYGYPNVGKYFSSITKDEQEEYLKVHWECCGCWHGKLVKLA
jgi:hypothetical protein